MGVTGAAGGASTATASTASTSPLSRALSSPLGDRPSLAAASAALNVSFAISRLRFCSASSSLRSMFAASCACGDKGGERSAGAGGVSVPFAPRRRRRRLEFFGRARRRSARGRIKNLCHLSGSGWVPRLRRNAAGSGSHLAGFVLLRDVVDALDELLRDGRARFEPGHAELLGFLKMGGRRGDRVG